MTNNITNFIQFASDDLDNATGVGRISTITHDIEITAVPFSSENPDAPTHRVSAKSPRGFLLEVGAIWKGTNRQGGVKRTLTIKKGMTLNANLGRFQGQDDDSLQAIIEWD